MILTLKGDRIVPDFIKILNDYVDNRYSPDAAESTSPQPIGAGVQ